MLFRSPKYRISYDFLISVFFVQLQFFYAVRIFTMSLVFSFKFLVFSFNSLSLFRRREEGLEGRE